MRIRPTRAQRFLGYDMMGKGLPGFDEGVKAYLCLNA